MTSGAAEHLERIDYSRIHMLRDNSVLLGHLDAVPEMAVCAASFVTGPNLAFPLSPTSVALRSGPLRRNRLDYPVGEANTRAPPGPECAQGTLLSGRSREHGQGETSDLLAYKSREASHSFWL